MRARTMMVVVVAAGAMRWGSAAPAVPPAEPAPDIAACEALPAELGESPVELAPAAPVTPVDQAPPTPVVPRRFATHTQAPEPAVPDTSGAAATLSQPEASLVDPRPRKGRRHARRAPGPKPRAFLGGALDGTADDDDDLATDALSIDVATRRGLRPDDVRAHVEGSWGQVRACYERALKTDASLHGRVVLAWEILADGSVQNTQLATGEVADAALTACLTRVVDAWTFPRGNEQVDVAFPFVFKRS